MVSASLPHTKDIYIDKSAKINPNVKHVLSPQCLCSKTPHAVTSNRVLEDGSNLHELVSH